MVVLLLSPADKTSIQKASEDLNGYVKFVVDINRGIMTIGGLRHVEGEQLLLQDGSHQENLWGAESGDYKNRNRQGNFSISRYNTSRAS